MLGVDIGDNFSVAQHVQCLMTSSAQTLYALRVLRNHGLSDEALQRVYRSTVVDRLTYAAIFGLGLDLDLEHLASFNISERTNGVTCVNKSLQCSFSFYFQLEILHTGLCTFYNH